MREIIELVTAWYEINKRDIPWRNDPSGYHIWLSEIMCQQTRIDTVIPYYLRFINEIPTIKDLSEVDDDKLMKLWEGLGYYSRARNLKETAKMIMEKYNGLFPMDYNEALKLKGIGEYTAGAILSIAYQLPYSAVDGNVLRVLTRVYCDEDDIGIETTKRKYKQMIEACLDQKPGDFNQGLMDLGATICIPNGTPLCDRCPLKDLCVAHLYQCELDYPKKEKKLDRKVENYTVVIVRKDNKILIHKRGKKGLLAGLYEPKMYPGLLSRWQIEGLMPGAAITRMNDSEFVFTHKIWHMFGYIADVKDYTLLEDELFVSFEELRQQYSIPTAFKAYLK